MDPPVLHTLAERYGKEIAAGDLDYYEALARLASIAIWHKRITCDQFDGALDRATRTMVLAAEADALEAAREIRNGLQALLDQHATTERLCARAYVLSRARLLRPQCNAIVYDEIARRLKKGRRHG